MTVTLPDEVKRVFDRFITCEYTTVDAGGQPITWPVTPYHHVEVGCIDITTGLGYPKKARDAARNPQVSLLFSDPTGSGLERPPMVLVQGTADVDDRDLGANRRRYEEESARKLPHFQRRLPPAPLRFAAQWYFMRIYVHVRPERVYVWPDADPAAEPQLFDAHMEEVRSGHSEEPEVEPAPADTGPVAWDARLGELGRRHPTAVVAFVGPDGFPFSVRVPVEVDEAARRIRLGAEPVGAPLRPGRACLAAHAHDERFTQMENFQVRGELVRDDGGWALVPHRLVSGMEMPKGTIAAYRANASRWVRLHRRARRELARRRG